MRLICNATTPQELREEIVILLRHRAAQQELRGKQAKRNSLKDQHQWAAMTLADLALDVELMEITSDDPLASDGSPRVLDAATKGREEWKD
jgi:hypothetical protein